MVDENGLGGVSLQSRIELVITLKVEVQLSPVEVASIYGHFLCHLGPVTTGLQGSDDMVGVVAATTGERIGLGSDIRGRFGRCSCCVRRGGQFLER